MKFQIVAGNDVNAEEVEDAVVEEDVAEDEVAEDEAVLVGVAVNALVDESITPPVGVIVRTFVGIGVVSHEPIQYSVGVTIFSAIVGTGVPAPVPEVFEPGLEGDEVGAAGHPLVCKVVPPLERSAITVFTSCILLLHDHTSPVP